MHVMACAFHAHGLCWQELLYGRLRAVRRACPSFPLIAMVAR